MHDDVNLLVEQAKNGDRQAFAKLYNRYYRLIRYIIFDIIKNPTITEDLISDTFLKALEKLKYYKTHVNFEAWLKTIAVNTTIDYIRAEKEKKKDLSIDDIDKPTQIRDTIPDAETNFIHAESIEVLKVALSRLSTKHRNLIQWRYYDGLSYIELGAKLGVPVGTIKSDLSQAKKRLRRIFDELSN